MQKVISSAKIVVVLLFRKANRFCKVARGLKVSFWELEVRLSGWAKSCSLSGAVAGVDRFGFRKLNT